MNSRKTELIKNNLKESCRIKGVPFTHSLYRKIKRMYNHLQEKDKRDFEIIFDK